MTAGQAPKSPGPNDPVPADDRPRTIKIHRRSTPADFAGKPAGGIQAQAVILPSSPALVLGMNSPPPQPAGRYLPIGIPSAWSPWWRSHAAHEKTPSTGFRRARWGKSLPALWRNALARPAVAAGEAVLTRGAAAIAARIRQTYGRARGTCVICTTSETGPWAAQVVEELSRCLAADGAGGVLAIDAQLEFGQLSERFRLRAARGMSDALLGGCRLSEVIYPSGCADLHVLPAGTSGPAGRQVLARMHGETELGPWLGRLRQRFGVLLFAAPEADLAETLALARSADVSLLVVPLHVARRQPARRAVRLLRAQGCAVAGVAVTLSPPE